MQKILEGNFFYKDRHHLYRKKKKKDGANQICNQRKKNDPMANLLMRALYNHSNSIYEKGLKM